LSFLLLVNDNNPALKIQIFIECNAQFTLTDLYGVTVFTVQTQHHGNDGSQVAVGVSEIHMNAFPWSGGKYIIHKDIEILKAAQRSLIESFCTEST